MRLAALTDRIVSASASIIAILALATGLYQAKLSRDQARAAVWPYLISGNSGENGYSRIVQNVGVGPAIIGTFEVTVRNTPVHSWKEMADSLHLPISFRGMRSTTFRRGLVVPTNATESVHLFELPDSNDIRLIRSKIDSVDFLICYCSLYHECWENYGDIQEPTPVKVCRDDRARSFAR